MCLMRGHVVPKVVRSTELFLAVCAGVWSGDRWVAVDVVDKVGLGEGLVADAALVPVDGCSSELGQVLW